MVRCGRCRHTWIQPPPRQEEQPPPSPAAAPEAFAFEDFPTGAPGGRMPAHDAQAGRGTAVIGLIIVLVLLASMALTWAPGTGSRAVLAPAPGASTSRPATAPASARVLLFVMLRRAFMPMVSSGAAHSRDNGSREEGLETFRACGVPLPIGV